MEKNYINKIAQYFNIGIIENIELVKSGISNQNYYLKTSKGQFVVKFLKNQSIDSIKNDIYINKQLNRVNIKSPKYILSNTENYIYSNGKINAVVSKKLDGENPKVISDELAYSYGYTLALFHTNVRSLPFNNSLGLINPQISKIKTEIFDKHLPTGIIHGDFHSGNALVDSKEPNKISAMLDFEESGENLFLVDLALTVMGVCSKDNDSVDKVLIESTIRGYQCIRKLTHLEIECFNDAINYVANAWINWFEENGYEKYSTRHHNKLNIFNEVKGQIIFK